MYKLNRRVIVGHAVAPSVKPNQPGKIAPTAIFSGISSYNVCVCVFFYSQVTQLINEI